jgi:DNA-binding response OmpR family regulator
MEDTHAPSVLPPLISAKILHADDNDANRYAVSRTLRKAGFEVSEVATGGAALDALALSVPDLIILDVRLPDISGFEVCRRIKADPRTGSLPVLHLTASLVTTRDKVEGLESGADAYLVRPVEPLELVATIRALLRMRRTEEALRSLNQTLERRVAERTAELLAHQRRLRELVGELGRAEQRERQRLATELHDNLVQLLAVCKMRVSAIAAAAAPRSRTAREAGVVKTFLDEGIAYARSLMAELGPVVLNEHDLAVAVESVGKRMERHGLKVAVVDDGQPKPLDGDLLGLMFQGVRELLFNVVKHAHTNAAAVTLERHGGEVRVTVTDSGAGFDASRQHGPSTEGGFGLLSIRERLDLLGGRVEIHSAPGSGTRVTMVAPLDSRGNGSEGARTASPRDVPQGRAVAAAADVRVLLADDHRITREGLKSILEEQPGVRVVGEAWDGVEAVALARTLQPDVIIMDVHMPRLNGLDATRQVKAERPGVKVIGLSVRTDEEIAGAMRAAGAAAYLSKGAEIETLLAAIHAPSERIEDRR